MSSAVKSDNVRDMRQRFDVGDDLQDIAHTFSSSEFLDANFGVGLYQCRIVF